MTSAQLYLFFSIFLLAVLLFFPVSKLILVFSARRLQRRLQRELEPAEIAGQRRRARLIAAVVVLVFSYLFNISFLGKLHG
ncbi:MAG: hypothetical protein R6X17_15770 [Candidatus Competibacteraceae bacterium]